MVDLGKTELIKRIASLIGKDKIYVDPSIIKLYSREPSGLEAEELPLAVVFPENTSDVSRIVSFAYNYDVKIFPQGSLSSLSGSAVPVDRGIILSFERMNNIVEVNPVDNYVEVEAGVRIDELNLELNEYGYTFPVDPASSAVATIGGAINSGAGGMRSVKYGTMRDWVLGLEVVFADSEGTIARIGCKTVKCRQGYDLTRLIVGSEGTLVVVTRAILRITPLPENIVTMLAFYESMDDLLGTVIELREKGIQPYILEFMDDKTVEVCTRLGNTKIKAEGNMLLLSLDTDYEATNRKISVLENLAKKNNAKYIVVSRSIKEAEEKGLFDIRKSLFPSQVLYAKQVLGLERNPMVYIEDIAVPPSKLVDAIREIRVLESRYSLPTLIGGHIGDGNIHPAVGFDPDNPSHRRRVEEWYFDVMKVALRLGGTISAEHGIGLLKKKGLREELSLLGSEKAYRIMKQIKMIFDPRGILNPSKVVDIE